MRALALLPIPFLLVACERERSFEERYTRAAKTVEEQASEIDRDLTRNEAIEPCRDGKPPDCR